ncbi:MAG: pseudaminic acid synthase [Candidatus Peribacteraceae bacterium]|jgi:pseudaminic acid synthase|nr:pseudaminic acid synthase [Candidatus Peribacteraceae bacterium]
MKDIISINGRAVGEGHPAYIIAELSANHGGNFDRAIETICAMKESGADAVKLQTYTADTMTIESDREEFRIKGTMWEGKTLHQLYGEAMTPWEWQPKLKAEAERLGLDCFSSPFDATAIEFLEKMNVPAYKIASFEITDLPLIAFAARKGKPMIISTGMASEQEIQEAVACSQSVGNDQIILLKCTSTYPAPPEEMNLRTIPDMRERFKVPVGLSDHSLELAIPIAAVALGTCAIEKHFCLSRKEPGPDTAFSLEPQEFRAMVDAVRITERALGTVSYEPSEKEKTSKKFRRSLYAVEPIAKGEVFTEKNIRSIRPANGLPPKELPNVLSKHTKSDIERGTPLSWTMIEGNEGTAGND